MSIKQFKECPRCGIEANLKREFSAQAIVSLIKMGDLRKN